MRKTGRRWSTEECGRCGDKHASFSGKLDANDQEYVVCASTNKRMNVHVPRDIRDAAYPTKWTLDNPASLDVPDPLE